MGHELSGDQPGVKFPGLIEHYWHVLTPEFPERFTSNDDAAIRLVLRAKTILRPRDASRHPGRAVRPHCLFHTDHLRPVGILPSTARLSNGHWSYVQNYCSTFVGEYMIDINRIWKHYNGVI